MIPNTATGKVYFRITNNSPNTVAVLNTANVATALPVSLGPANIIRVNPTLNRIYVGGQGAGQPNQIHVLNGANDQEIATLTLGAPTTLIGNQSYLAVDRTRGRLYVTDFRQHTLSVVDGTTNAVIATVPVGHGPSTVAVNEVRNRIYVGNGLDQTLTIVDGSTMRVVRTVSLPSPPTRIDVDTDGQNVAVIGWRSRSGRDDRLRSECAPSRR